MEIAIIVLGILLILIGFTGSILPALPGPPLAYVSLLVLFFIPEISNEYADNNYTWLIAIGVITLAITILDYYMPIWGTKKFGGTKAGSRGSTLGLIVAVVLTFFTSGFAALLIIAGPFIGAYIGEKNAGQGKDVALKSAIGSFLGFITGTFMKVLVVGFIAIYFTVVLL